MPPKSRKRKSGPQAPPSKRARIPVTPSAPQVESLSLEQLKSLSSAVLMLHLQSHHLVTSGSAQLKAQRLYESLHPEDTTGTINSITTSDTTGTTVDTTSQDELLGKVQGMLDSKMKDMEQRLTNLIATNQAGSPPSATPPDNISDSSVIGENLHEDLTHSPLQLSQHVTTPPLISKSLPPVPVKLREKIL